MIGAEQAVIAAILVCLAGALASLLVSGNKKVAGWVACLAVCIASTLVFVAVTRVLLHGPAPLSMTFWSIPALGIALRIHVDGLSALFLAVAAGIAIPASLYSIDYLDHYERHGAAGYYPYLLVFQAAMIGLVSTTDMMWFFFLFWQMMTIPGYALIRYEREAPQSARAGRRYLWMMEIACLVTLAGAELLAIPDAPLGSIGSFKYDFHAVSEHLPLLMRDHPSVFVLASALFLTGFGIKMGMWPFGQIWLPDAHPAAPSPVSAMLSGVMIKTGVYGLLRYSLWLVPRAAYADYPLAAWGAVVAGLGTLTLFSGTAQALRQEQSKRLLAFHSIGQIGYVVLGIGTCMALLGTRRPELEPLAALALLGALFHVVNHALFKSLLFLNAGSMLYATRSQDLNTMGGLARLMPMTALTALVASLSIAGVPLLNGFASKWAILVAAVRGSTAAPYLAVCAALAIVTGALTLASFVKFYGASFLSRRSALVEERARARPLEVSGTMQLPQIALAATCVLVGLAPGLAIGVLERALDTSRTGLGTILADATPTSISHFGGLEALAGAAVLAPLGLALVLLATLAIAFAIGRVGEGTRRSAEPWLCGYARDSELWRYSAHHWYAELKRHFAWLGGAPRMNSSDVHSKER